jgi:uncharacterized protein (DUF2249 family)
METLQKVSTTTIGEQWYLDISDEDFQQLINQLQKNNQGMYFMKESRQGLQNCGSSYLI